MSRNLLNSFNNTNTRVEKNVKNNLKIALLHAGNFGVTLYEAGSISQKHALFLLDIVYLKSITDNLKLYFKVCRAKGS
jgi:hypothetical protein